MVKTELMDPCTIVFGASAGLSAPAFPTLCASPRTEKAGETPAFLFPVFYPAPPGAMFMQ